MSAPSGTLDKSLSASVYVSASVHVCVLSHFSYVQLCNPMDHSRLGSSVHEILQTRILESVAMPTSRGFSRPRDQTHLSYTSCIDGQSARG